MSRKSGAIQFGISVALEDGLALIGANGSSQNGAFSGAAYLFERGESAWNQVAKLTADDANPNDQFGNSVSLSGNIAVIGAFLDGDNGAESGSVYIFERTGSVWTKSSKLTASDGSSSDQFGRSVSASQGRLLIGAPFAGDFDAPQGVAYIFERNGSNWVQTARLFADDGSGNDRFGISVSLSGGRALIGASRDDDNGTDSGSAYIFELSGSDWIQTTKLIASDAAQSDFFGTSVNLLNDRALVGAFNGDGTSSNSGLAYIFELKNSDWIETAKLMANDGAQGDGFGFSLSQSSDWALVGALLDDQNGDSSGSSYLFERIGTLWTQTAKLTADDGSANDEFGNSVSLSGNRALIGSLLDDDNGTNSGSAYVFKLEIFEDGFES